MSWRHVFNIADPPTSEKMQQQDSKTANKDNVAVFPFTRSANAKTFTELPAELAQLIETVGRLYKADAEDTADMKAHVLSFINQQPNGLAIALNGFRQLAAEFSV